MRVIVHMIVKEFLQLRRDPAMLRLMFVAPLFQLIILGYAANLDVVTVSTVVCDQDRSAESRDFLRAFSQSGTFTLDRAVDTPGKIDRYLDNGTSSLALVIPRGFARHIQAGTPVAVQALVDGSDTIAATTGLNYAEFITAAYSQAVLLERVRRMRPQAILPGRVTPQPRIWYNPTLTSRNFMIPGVLGLLLMVVTMNLTSMAVVKEKEIGTMEQLIVSPIRAYQLVLGKLIPFVIIGFLEAVLAVTVASAWFGIPVRGSVPLLYALCGVYLMTTLGLGLFISTIARTQQQAMIMAVFFVGTPMMILSGFVFPIENMPRVIQYVTYIFPLRYFFVIIRGIFLKGVGMVELWDEALALAIFGVGILALSIMRFQKKLS